ncbi:hypothetical protein diail_10442 [Diaporthe ilicicola]|nr:hypothetical protein diail_10442 [Diaporthe ilicicola]
MSSQLPDPTADLDWSGFVGPIHERFRASAEAHPDRTFVQCAGHYLHDAGVTNGDVVMIWAHRSADLVVSIMGTLASGATMNVLDPAYPPARQQVYLEVSQPRALVRIGRATDENGPLAPLAQSYIDGSLQLKAEVPELRLRDDGYLFGGEVDGQDVFQSARQKASSPPDVLVGPDSNPTLSFTSGSEGRPKGVLARHFSLTRYYGWMAERFKLSSESKFTMLSAKEDIQHEQLAEWMSEHKPTVSHLTPAMGQILVGGASAQFPSLQNVFFVGDILTTRDCRFLRRLAVNANIINMYATTETQRAVSYYEIPSAAKDPDYLNKLKDTVPARKGMQNVQLLVVSRKDKTRMCKVGEVGEIYCRAAGLAEGYLGDEQKNAEKFLNNWFVDSQKWVELDAKNSMDEPWRKYYQGPGDRLYRTGDLGRYLEIGDVECTGRADHQCKIRGFRIELNDIDSNLSQHPLIPTLSPRRRNGSAGSRLLIVARVVVAGALSPLAGGVRVAQVTAHPRLRMNEYLSILEYYGYKTPEVSYDAWKEDLERFVSAGPIEKDQEQHALMPLFHFCMNDLPANTRAPELDDRNAVAVLKRDVDRYTGVDESMGYGVSREDAGRYLRYLAETKYIGLPSERGRQLPDIKADIASAKAAGGRGGA